MKRSLTFKMFMALFASFVLLSAAIIGFLYIYFNFIYRDVKITRMTEAISEFAQRYESEGWTEYEFYKEISNFNDKNNISLSVHSADGSYYSEDSGAIMRSVVSDSQEVQSDYMITIKIDDSLYDIFVVASDYAVVPGLADDVQGDEIDVRGYIYSGNMIMPLFLNGYQVGDEKTAEIISQDPGAVYIDETAEFVSKSLFSNVITYDHEGSATGTTVQNSGTETNEKNNVSYSVSDIPYTNLSQVHFTSTVSVDGQIQTLEAYMSLHPVAEIAGTMTSFLPWFILGSVVLALLVSFIFSRTISRPILEITCAADDMAAMKLDTRIDIGRKDELGRLSESLNKLSSNLDEAMGELVEKNRTLAEDYARKEREEESRKEFIANVSHELKTPLGVIRGYTEAIRDGVKTDKHGYYMDVILDETERMDSLLEEMMRLSKFDEDAVSIEEEEIDMDRMVGHISGGLAEAARQRGLSFKVKPPLGRVLGDGKKIHQVVFNLLSNAVKYADENTVIRVESIVSDNGNCIYINNDCPPVPKEVLERIWERFYKADTSHNREMDGSGLGLAIVKSILDRHGAEYGVYNTRTGICFYFRLPSVTPPEDK